MDSHTPLLEKGHTSLVLAPDLELSLSEAQELVSLIERWSAVRGVTVHWQAGVASPPVLVDASPRHFDRAVDKLLSEIGGFGSLGTSTDQQLENPKTNTGRALVVAPDEALREVGASYLAVIGLDVDDVATAEEAMTRVQEEEYDLLVVTNTNPGEASAHQLLQALEPYLIMTTPVIFWTGARLESAAKALQDLRVPLMLMSKPNDFRDFREKVGRALEWRHLVRLRRRVRAHIESQVAARVSAIAADILGPSVRPQASQPPRRARSLQ